MRHKKGEWDGKSDDAGKMEMHDTLQRLLSEGLRVYGSVDGV